MERLSFIKHNRLENFEKGTLYNAVCSVMAQYIILRILINYLVENSGKEYVIEYNCSKFWIPVI